MQPSRLPPLLCPSQASCQCRFGLCPGGPAPGIPQRLACTLLCSNRGLAGQAAAAHARRSVFLAATKRSRVGRGPPRPSAAGSPRRRWMLRGLGARGRGCGCRLLERRRPLRPPSTPDGRPSMPPTTQARPKQSAGFRPSTPSIRACPPDRPTRVHLAILLVAEAHKQIAEALRPLLPGAIAGGGVSYSSNDMRKDSGGGRLVGRASGRGWTRLGGEGTGERTWTSRSWSAWSPFFVPASA